MPITIARTGPAAILDDGGMSQEAKDELWGMLLRAYVQRHPEVLLTTALGIAKDDVRAAI